MYKYYFFSHKKNYGWSDNTQHISMDTDIYEWKQFSIGLTIFRETKIKQKSNEKFLDGKASKKKMYIAATAVA
jgi:hypothetical protein